MDEPLEAQIGYFLRQRGWKLAAAESCTGGLIAHRITNIPGSSDYFIGGIVSYAYEAKVKLLGVQWDTLNTCGAVSREVVLEMAQGIRRSLGAEIGISVSGIAGPGGGTPEKPVGTVWFGLSAPDQDLAWTKLFQGNRISIKEQSAQEALWGLFKYLNGTN
jgi:PncC family amidohydrolase